VWGFEGARTNRKVRPPKELQTRGVKGHAPPETLSNLRAQKSIPAFFAGHLHLINMKKMQ